MTDVLSQPVVHAIAQALGHFVWQGATIGLVMLGAFRLFRASPSARYAIGVAGLAAMLAAPVITFAVIMNAAQPAIDLAAQTTTGAGAVANAAALPTSAGTPVSSSTHIDWQAIAVVAWMVGAIGFTLRLAGGWVVARRFATRAVEPASEHITVLVRQLAERMNVRRAIAIVQSSAISVPVMMGWLKPTIVLPVAALVGLSPDQIEALIAHELAHVKRHDYLVNLLQSTVEALLFYHPAVWWLSRRVRAERELCCDDLAVGVCDRLVYATALTDLAAMASPGLALAATDGDLLARVRRILGREHSSPAGRPAAVPLLAIALVAAIVVPTAIASVPPPQHPMTAPHAGVDAATHDVLHPQASPTASAEVQDAHRAQLEAVRKQIDEFKHWADTGQTASPAAQEAVRKHLEELRKKIDEFKHWAEAGQTASPEVQEVRKHLEALHKKVDEMQHAAATKNALTHQETAQTVDQAKLAREAELAALQQQIERTKQLYERGLATQAQLNEALAALARAQAKGDVQATHAIDLAARQQELERVTELFRRGLVSQAQLHDAEAALVKAQANGDALATAAAELKAAQIELERAKSLAAKGLTSSNTLAALEQTVADRQRQVVQTEEARKEQLAMQAANLQADAKALREQVATQQSSLSTETFYLSNANVMEVVQILNQMLTTTAGPRPTITANAETKSITVQATAPMLALVKNIIATVDKPRPAQSQDSQLRTIENLSPTTALQAGDIVSLTIADEPGLPKMYPVAADGTIRVPFLGSIKVSGLNASQVKDAIGKKLAEKKLGSVDQVTVSAARPPK